MLIVQKYGGSSLATADRIRHVAGRIARERAEGERLVVVVSAMGDTTDDLLALAAQITPDPDPRELDVLLATGEHMSGTLVAMALHAMGVPAISLTGPQAGIRTDTRHGRARIANVDPARLVRELDAGRVVIVAGFQGATGEGFLESDVTTLGRGGSDTTAVALAARLGADRCEILTDVDGIYTADPRVVPEARLSCPSSATRRCSSWPSRAPRSCRRGPSNWAGSTASSSPCARRSPTIPARASGRTRSWSSATRCAAWPPTATSPRSRSSGCPTGRASPTPCSRRWPRRASTST